MSAQLAPQSLLEVPLREIFLDFFAFAFAFFEVDFFVDLDDFTESFDFKF